MGLIESLSFPQDERGQFPYDANNQIHWVSFLDGRQRVLLFTDDVALVSKALQAEEMEQADHEITFSLLGLGLSLVNNEKKQEVSYIGITRYGRREISHQKSLKDIEFIISNLMSKHLPVLNLIYYTFFQETLRNSCFHCQLVENHIG